jgi:hypothetical protein
LYRTIHRQSNLHSNLFAHPRLCFEQPSIRTRANNWARRSLIELQERRRQRIPSHRNIRDNRVNQALIPRIHFPICLPRGLKSLEHGCVVFCYRLRSCRFGVRSTRSISGGRFKRDFVSKQTREWWALVWCMRARRVGVVEAGVDEWESHPLFSDCSIECKKIP